jgi:hypothetical protein
MNVITRLRYIGDGLLVRISSAIKMHKLAILTYRHLEVNIPPTYASWACKLSLLELVISLTAEGMWFNSTLFS